MKKQTFILMLLVIIFLQAKAQQYFTKNGSISFFSHAPLEDIKADNNQVISVIDFSTGSIQFSVLNNAFHFPKAKMEEHFNEDYIESNKFPKSSFKGSVSGLSENILSREGKYIVTVAGELMIHGVAKHISASGAIVNTAGNISATAVFKIHLHDFNISIPSVVIDNISPDVEITVKCTYLRKN